MNRRTIAMLAVLASAIVAAAALAANAPARPSAPHFSLCDQKGKLHTLRSLKGRVVLVDFGRAICIPCRSVLGMLGELHTKYSGKGVAVYSVNLGVPRETVAEYTKQNKLTFPFLEDPGMAVTRKYNVQTIPYLVVIDKAGRIADTHLGFSPDLKDKLETRIQALLAEKPAAAGSKAK